MKYDLIACDPPWDYRQAGAIRNFAGTRRARARAHYQTMPVEELMAMRPALDGLAAPDCLLAMWGTWPKLDDYMELGRAWGFEWLTCGFLWVKVAAGYDELQGELWTDDEKSPAWTGLGFYTRGNTEFMGFWRRGRPPLPGDRSVRQVIHAPRREHSRKPAEALRRLERLWPDAVKLEMFARESVSGWAARGNEVGKFDEPADTPPDPLGPGQGSLWDPHPDRQLTHPLVEMGATCSDRDGCGEAYTWDAEVQRLRCACGYVYDHRDDGREELGTA